MIEVRVSSDPFDLNAVIAALGRDGVGAVASFVGIVRGDGGLVALTLEHYPAMTEAALYSIAAAARARWGLSGIHIHHRVGRLTPGTPIVLTATAAPHRADALDACAFLIDRLKTDAPFWKHERFADGHQTWVEANVADRGRAEGWIGQQLPTPER